jgi:hypothetical protein
MLDSTIGTASNHVFERLVAGLESEFGARAGERLARHFIAAEDGDFYWEARHAQRWLGAYESLDDADEWLDRMAAMGRFGDRFYVAILIMDGANSVQAMTGLREFETQEEALAAYTAAR